MDTAAFTRSPSPPTMSPAQFAARLGRADSPWVLDVRRPAAFAASQRMLPAARHCPPDEVRAFGATHTPSEVLVYCVYGHNVGFDAASQLRDLGWQASYLQGGIEGGEGGVDPLELMNELRLQRLPTLAKRADLGVDGVRISRWITRERPKIDRIACPWLVRRFIDARAEFVYVPKSAVFAQAAALDAIAYDIPGAPLEHGGELCSFDAFLAAFELRLPALDLLAQVVRGADTDRLDLSAQSAGLLSISLGYSRLYAHDDLAMLAAMLPVYDALYAWCGDQVAQVNEQHRWTP